MAQKLTGLARQDAFLDKLDSTPLFCPSCRGKHTVKELQGDKYKLGSASESGKCPVTQEPVKRGFTIVGGEMFLTLDNPEHKK